MLPTVASLQWPVSVRAADPGQGQVHGALDYEALLAGGSDTLADPQRSGEQIRAIIARQKTEEEFKKIADYQVINDDSQLILPQILSIHQAVLSNF